MKRKTDKKDSREKVFWGPPPEVRFPNRLSRVRLLGIAIAMAAGEFSPAAAGDGRLKCASLGDFEISLVTPFNRPKLWRGIDWEDRRIPDTLYGLFISLNGETCLETFWTHDESYLNFFRDPRIEGWDRKLARLWEERCARAAL